MPIASKQADIESPQLGLFDLLYGDIDSELEDKVAIIDVADGTETTYAELRTYTESAAGGLYHLGIQPGDVVALHCPNSLGFIVAAHAVWRLGAVLSPVSLLATEDSIAAQLEDSGASMLLTVAALGDTSANAAKAVGVEQGYFSRRQQRTTTVVRRAPHSSQSQDQQRVTLSGTALFLWHYCPT